MLGGAGKLFCTMRFLPAERDRADWSRMADASVTRQNAGFSLAFFATMLCDAALTGNDSRVCALLTKLYENRYFSSDPLDRFANDVYDWFSESRECSGKRAPGGGRVSLVRIGEARRVCVGFSFIRYR